MHIIKHYEHAIVSGENFMPRDTLDCIANLTKTFLYLFSLGVQIIKFILNLLLLVSFLNSLFKLARLSFSEFNELKKILNKRNFPIAQTKYNNFNLIKKGLQSTSFLNSLFKFK